MFLSERTTFFTVLSKYKSSLNIVEFAWKLCRTVYGLHHSCNILWCLMLPGLLGNFLFKTDLCLWNFQSFTRWVLWQNVFCVYLLLNVCEKNHCTAKTNNIFLRKNSIRNARCSQLYAIITNKMTSLLLPKYIPPTRYPNKRLHSGNFEYESVTWYATERGEVRFNLPSPSVFDLTAQWLTAEAVGNKGQTTCTP